MAVVMYLYNETGSTTLSTTATLISIASRMVSGMFLPAISDRFKLSTLLMLSQLTQLVFLSGLIILIHQRLSVFILVLLFVFMSFISFFNGFFSPIKSSIVRAIVSERDRVRANSFISSVDQTFLFAGWTFGGLLLSILGKAATLGIAFFLILLSVGSLCMVKVSEISNIESKEGLISRLTAGWKYLFQHQGLRIMIAMDLIEAFVGTIWIGAVTLTYVKEALGKSETWWGYINGAYYLGTIIGGLMVYRLSKMMRGRLAIFMIFGSMMFGLLTFIYGFVSNPYLALFLVLLMGPSYQIRDLAQETMYQNSASEKILTKILSAKNALVQLMIIFSIIGIGVLTDLIGVRLVYILSGCLLMFSALFGFVHLYVRKKGLYLESESA
ncbi:MFS family permease [Anoxybacillus caldiproteolyticus]|uniref:MFS family permease n=2 Tax=Thermaerobacillus caldiproteolyticus TaxID=247480 RepID=A0A7V9Z8V2_9BACL|nr:MFS family permease [Anoxybacillus caldiproteolyticus]